jgi:hypothetical protein
VSIGNVAAPVTPLIGRAGELAATAEALRRVAC